MCSIVAISVAEVVCGLVPLCSEVCEGEKVMVVAVPRLESDEATGEEVGVIQQVVVKVVVDLLPKMTGSQAG